MVQVVRARKLAVGRILLHQGNPLAAMAVLAAQRGSFFWHESGGWGPLKKYEQDSYASRG